MLSTLEMKPKALLVSFEHLETRVLASLSCFLDANEISSDILFTDFYQLTWRDQPYFIRELAGQIDGSIFGLERAQIHLTRENDISSYRSTLSRLTSYLESRLPGMASMIDDLLFSDHYFNHFERRPFYASATKEQMHLFLFSVVSNVYELLKAKRYDHIIILGTNYLAKRVVAHVGSELSIPITSIVKSRLSNYYYLARSFPTLPDFCHYEVDIHRRKDQCVLGESPSIYRSQSADDMEMLQGTDIRLYATLLYKATIKGAALVHRFMIVRSDSISFYRDRLFGRILYEYKKVLFLYRNKEYLPDFREVDGVGDFFYYPLNSRPESSTLILSCGFDDESSISHILSVLPAGVKLVVKENPSMVYTRPRIFYKKLRCDPRVVVVSHKSSNDLIYKAARGVVCISGTALLESLALGIPCHALGLPEFKSFLPSYGRKRTEKFIMDSLAGTISKVELKRRFSAYKLLVETIGFSIPSIENQRFGVSVPKIVWPESIPAIIRKYQDR